MLYSIVNAFFTLIRCLTMCFAVASGLFYATTNPKAVIAIACMSMITLPLVYNENYNVVTAKLKAMKESIARMW